jgi:hypothetical protein
MSTPTRRFLSFTRLLPAALLMLALATPAAAQFGGLKKKIKAAAGDEAKGEDSTRGKDGAAPPAGGGGGGGVVALDDKVVGQLIAGLKAAQAEREAAKKEDNSYSRYHRDVAAYEAAKAKCQEAQGTFGTRAAADQKFAERYTGYTEKMLKAQQAGDNDLVQAWSDSALAMMDPSCLIKQPKQPDDYYDAQREFDRRAEEQEIKGSGLSRSELAMAKERAYSILLDRMAPGDASASEKAAVNSRSAELKPLLGLEEAPPARAKKAAPAPAPAPTPAQPAVSPEQSAMANCMAGNAQKHEKEIEALGQRAQAAQQANDMNKLMAIADSIQKLQMAGCQ